MRYIVLTILLWLLVGVTYCQEADSSQLQEIDTIDIQAVQSFDSTVFAGSEFTSYRNILLREKETVNHNIQQARENERKMFSFFLLLALLIVLTYIKVAFNKEVEELFQGFFNSNIAQQIFRTQSGDFSFSSFLLQTNFIVAISLFTQFVLLNYFQLISINNFITTLILIFLFTFFYLAKIVIVKFLGHIFYLKEEAAEYVFNYTSCCKLLGLTLIPALFVCYAAQEKFLNFILLITFSLIIVQLLIFVWRGLSTGIKLMYKSVYHFFIYVCVVEISSIFLLFKLLTKTIT